MKLGSRLYSLFEGVRIALDAIRSNKVRAGLTILGIAVGVFVVTVMSAAVHGINAGVSKSMAAAGPTTFFVTKWPAEINSCLTDRPRAAASSASSPGRLLRSVKLLPMNNRLNAREDFFFDMGLQLRKLVL